jgi:hypothetical protein
MTYNGMQLGALAREKAGSIMFVFTLADWIEDSRPGNKVSGSSIQGLIDQNSFFDIFSLCN